MKKLRWREQLRPVLAAVCCTLFFSAALQSIQSSIRFTEREERLQSYGAWDCAVTGGAGVGERASRHLSVRRAGIMRCYTGKESGLLAGTADEAAIELGRLTLLEGRWPQGPSDIAVEAWALVKNGYSPDLGQTIHVAGQPYTLCGVIRSYSQGWKSNFQTYEDVALQAVVSPAAPLAGGTPVTETALLAGDYGSYESRQELRTYTGGKVCHNDRAYPPEEGSFGYMFGSLLDQEEPFLALGLVCFLLTLYAVRTDRQALGRSAAILRDLGADRRQLRRYVLREYAAVWGLACLPLTLLGCAAAFLAVQALNAVFQARLRFHMSLPGLLAGCALAGLSLAAAAAVPAGRPERRRRRKRLCRLRRASSLAGRRMLFHLPRTLGRVLCYTLILCAGMLALVQTHLHYCTYREGAARSSYAYCFQPERQNMLLPLETLEAVEEIDGIKFADAGADLTGCFSQDDPLRVTWETAHRSEYLRRFAFQLDRDPDSVVDVLAVNDSLWSYFCGLYGLSVPAEGHSAIAVFFPFAPLDGRSYFFGTKNLDKYGPEDLWEEDTLSVGDTLTIQPPGQEGTAFTVGGIISGAPASGDTSRVQSFFWGPTILIPMDAMEDVAGRTGLSMLYAYGDASRMNGAVSDRQAAILATAHRARLENNRELMASRQVWTIRSICLYIIAALFLTAFALVVLSNGARSGLAADRESNAVLLALGAERGQVAGLYRRESLVVSGLSIVLSAALLWSVWIGPEIGGYVRRWGGAPTALQLFVENNTQFIPAWVYAIAALALILLPIAAELLPVRREERSL